MHEAHGDDLLAPAHTSELICRFDMALFRSVCMCGNVRVEKGHDYIYKCLESGILKDLRGIHKWLGRGVLQSWGCTDCQWAM
jgi:hypothetical protein